MIGNYRGTQPIDKHNPFLITNVKTKKVDLYVADKLYLSNKEDGSVVVNVNQTNGASASFNPKLDGTFQIDYSDDLGRVFSISSDGDDFEIGSFVQNATNASKLISSEVQNTVKPALTLKTISNTEKEIYLNAVSMSVDFQKRCISAIADDDELIALDPA